MALISSDHASGEALDLARHADRCVVLLSGGLDSATVLALARSRGAECHTVAFDYGQRHRAELIAAENLSRLLGAASHRTIAIDLRGIGGSALTDDIPVPKGRTALEMGGAIPVTYVPARNLIFLSLAAGIAEVLKAKALYIGVNAVDYSGYPDCRPEFIASFELTAALATQAGIQGGRLAVLAPLISLSKAQIIQLGLRLGVDYGLTHSCYDPVNVPEGGALACGGCDSCVLRREGFAAAGVPDPTRYVGRS